MQLKKKLAQKSSKACSCNQDLPRIHERILRDRTRAHTLCFFLFFSSFEHAKNLLIMGPNNTKISSLKWDFLIIISESCFYCKNTKFDQKTVSFLSVKTKSDIVFNFTSTLKWSSLHQTVSKIVPKKLYKINSGIQ